MTVRKMFVWKKKKKKDSKRKTMYYKRKGRGSSSIYKANVLLVYFIKQNTTCFCRVFSLEWYLAQSFFNPKKWPQLLKSCNSLSLFVFLWWFFSNTVLVIMENRAVIMLLEIRVLFDIFLVGMSLIKVNKIF
jgi:hypothetical protein